MHTNTDNTYECLHYLPTAAATAAAATAAAATAEALLLLPL